MIRKDDFQIPEHLVRHFLKILLVIAGHDHFFDAAAPRGQQFFTQAADGQNPTAQGNFAGHGHIVTHRNAQQG